MPTVKTPGSGIFGSLHFKDLEDSTAADERIPEMLHESPRPPRIAWSKYEPFTVKDTTEPTCTMAGSTLLINSRGIYQKANSLTEKSTPLRVTTTLIRPG